MRQIHLQFIIFKIQMIAPVIIQSLCNAFVKNYAFFKIVGNKYIDMDTKRIRLSKNARRTKVQPFITIQHQCFSIGLVFKYRLFARGAAHFPFHGTSLLRVITAF